LYRGGYLGGGAEFLRGWGYREGLTRKK